MFRRFLKNESGATAVEYGLIAGLVALSIIAGATAVGEAINNHFETAATQLEAAGKKD